jgi:hypothetical protein
MFSDRLRAAASAAYVAVCDLFRTAPDRMAAHSRPSTQEACEMEMSGGISLARETGRRT